MATARGCVVWRWVLSHVLSIRIRRGATLYICISLFIALRGPLSTAFSSDLAVRSPLFPCVVLFVLTGQVHGAAPVPAEGNGAVLPLHGLGGSLRRPGVGHAS